MRRLVSCATLLALGICLSGCLFDTHWQRYGSVTGYLCISNAQPPSALPEVYIGTDPPDGFVPWAFASVEILDAYLSTTTDAYGGFAFSGVPEGRQTMSVSDGLRQWEYEYDQPASALVFGSLGRQRSWTVMIYMIGDNSLGLGPTSYLIRDLNEMEMAHVDPNEISVLAFADPLNAWVPSGESGCCEPPEYAGARVYEIRRDLSGSNAIVSPVVASPRSSSTEVQTDSVDPDVLRSFVRWCRAFYPADRYALVLWDHGDGIAVHNGPGLEGAQARAIGPDQDGRIGARGRFMDVDQIASALSDLAVDLIGFDACLMGGVEVAYELRRCADVVVASEEVVLGPGWDYKDALERLSPAYDAWQYGVALVDSYAAAFENHLGSSPVLTCSAVRTGALSALVGEIDSLSRALAEALADPWMQPGVRDGFMSALRSTTRFGLRYGFHYYDLKDLCWEVYCGVSSFGWGLPGAYVSEIAGRAASVLQLLEVSETSRHLYSREVGDTDTSPCCGLSIYCASADTWDLDNPGHNYSLCEFGQDTRWFEVMSLL